MIYRRRQNELDKCWMAKELHKGGGAVVVMRCVCVMPLVYRALVYQVLRSDFTVRRRNGSWYIPQCFFRCVEAQNGPCC